MIWSVVEMGLVVAARKERKWIALLLPSRRSLNIINPVRSPVPWWQSHRKHLRDQEGEGGEGRMINDGAARIPRFVQY